MSQTMALTPNDPDSFMLELGDWVYCDGLDSMFGQVKALYPSKRFADVDYDGTLYEVEASIITNVKRRGALVWPLVETEVEVKEETEQQPVAAMATTEAAPEEEQEGRNVFPGGLVIWQGTRAQMPRPMRRLGATRLYVVLNYTKGRLRDTHVNIMPLNSMVEHVQGWDEGTYASVPRKFLKPVRLQSYDR